MRTVLLASILVILCQTVSADFWTILLQKTPKSNGFFHAIYQYYGVDPSAPAIYGNAIVNACDTYRTASTFQGLFGMNPDNYGYVNCIGDSVRPRGTSDGIHYLERSSEYETNSGCIIANSDELHDFYVCGDLIPLKPLTATTPAIPVPTIAALAISIPTTTTFNIDTKTTKTSTKTPTSTCITGYRGKRNGRGPINACCSHSDDCRDACSKGVCSNHS